MKSNLQTIVCMRERNFIMGRVAGILSSCLLTYHVFCRHFLKLSNVLFQSVFHMGRYSAFGYRPVWLLSKFSFLSWSSKTRFAPVTTTGAASVV
jgi:hypothetical protein